MINLPMETMHFQILKYLLHLILARWTTAIVLIILSSSSNNIGERVKNNPTMKTCKWRLNNKCRGLVLAVVIILILQLLNSVTYLYMLEQSNTVPICRGYSHIYEEDHGSLENETDFDSTHYFQLQINRKTALIYGHFRQNKSYLTIGIPTIPRKGINYLDETLTSLIKHTVEEERREIVIAVYLADSNRTWIQSTANRLKRDYHDHLQSGFIQIFHYYEQVFPDFTNLPRTFNDSYERVAWRSKQNIDYAFMFLYCKNISYYYMQLEDDVTVESRYFVDIQFFISNINMQKHWFCLEFSNLGFIGKLVRSNDLQDLANFLLMFYWEQPGDLLLGYLKQIKTQFEDIQRKPSLFKHKGIISSLDGKRQFLGDTFKWKTSYSRKRFYNFNPGANIETSIQVFEDHAPEKAYDMTDDYFWGINPKEGDHFKIKFLKPENITRIYIGFGLPQRTLDILDSGVVMVSPGNCNMFTTIGKIVHQKEFDTNITRTEIPKNIKCILLNVTRNQTSWVVIREISIFRAEDIIIENPSYAKNDYAKIMHQNDMIKRMQQNPIYAKQMQQQHIEELRRRNFENHKVDIFKPLLAINFENAQPNFINNKFGGAKFHQGIPMEDIFRKKGNGNTPRRKKLFRKIKH